MHGLAMDFQWRHWPKATPFIEAKATRGCAVRGHPGGKMRKRALPGYSNRSGLSIPYLGTDWLSV